MDINNCTSYLATCDTTTQQIIQSTTSSYKRLCPRRSMTKVPAGGDWGRSSRPHSQHSRLRQKNVLGNESANTMTSFCTHRSTLI